MHSKTMEVFWFDGTGDGIVKAELSNWSGEAIKIPRKEWRANNAIGNSQK